MTLGEIARIRVDEPRIHQREGGGAVARMVVEDGAQACASGLGVSAPKLDACQGECRLRFVLSHGLFDLYGLEQRRAGLGGLALLLLQRGEADQGLDRAGVDLQSPREILPSTVDVSGGETLLPA